MHARYYGMAIDSYKLVESVRSYLSGHITENSHADIGVKIIIIFCSCFSIGPAASLVLLSKNVDIWSL